MLYIFFHSSPTFCVLSPYFIPLCLSFSYLLLFQLILQFLSVNLCLYQLISVVDPMPLVYIYLGEFFLLIISYFLLQTLIFHFFSLREDPLSCLLVSVKHWRTLSFCLFKKSFISPLIKNNNISGYSILDCRSFAFQHLKHIIPLPTGLQLFC